MKRTRKQVIVEKEQKCKTRDDSKPSAAEHGAPVKHTERRKAGVTLKMAFDHKKNEHDNKIADRSSTTAANSDVVFIPEVKSCFVEGWKTNHQMIAFSDKEQRSEH